MSEAARPARRQCDRRECETHPKLRIAEFCCSLRWPAGSLSCRQGEVRIPPRTVANESGQRTSRERCRGDGTSPDHRSREATIGLCEENGRLETGATKQW